ncbi:RDD family protein [Stenotrophomonas sp. Marseille-Q4652]|uniref:RDD family protein n=1 Tax=Stenotrophomonas sp. Marseille-Q4652 TaxID=2866595 RepID=UPI001CE3B8E2|nr:RDD family protein [Stenotrophomonas sp. Marseille-Q4652]
MSEWYYADARRQQHGPVSSEELRAHFGAGTVDLSTLVWREGMAQWQPLSSMAAELDLQEPAPAPEPPEPTFGIDLRGDLSAIENGTATYTPYTAPSADLQANSAIVLGGEIVLAGFWKRVAAYFIDSVIVGIGGAVIGMIAGAVMGVGLLSLGGNASGPGFLLVQVVNYMLSLVIGAAYYAGFHASSGRATPGKMAVGIKVVRPNGEGITLARGIGRYFAAILSGLLLCIGYLMAAFTERKQGLHDLLCDTLVVDKWAFTEHPEWQQRNLGTVTIVILALLGVVAALLVLGLLAMIGMMMATLR